MELDTFRFEGFEYRRRERGLYRGARRLAVGSRALALLDLLLARPGIYISVSELMQAGWPDTYVDENNVRVQVSALRRHLAQCGRPIIQNAPGRGYAFVGRIDEAEASGAGRLKLVVSLTYEQGRLAPALAHLLEKIESGAETEHIGALTVGMARDDAGAWHLEVPASRTARQLK